MRTERNGEVSRPTNRLRFVALSLALFVGLLHSALSPGAGKAHAEGVDARPAIILALVDLCSQADHGAPAKDCHGPSGDCCLACEESPVLPPPERGDLATGLDLRGRAPRRAAFSHLIHVASGWRSSWSAQAPPFFS
jgi:hypothetical protein